MTGYAKIGGTTMPVWKAFSLALRRFFNVQVWSWIP
jgi:putative peptide zinc metalloprotease protein